MRIRNLTGKGQNIGHLANNPAYLDDARVLSLIQQAYDEGYGGVRWNWAFDSMCPEPGVVNTERLLFIVHALAERGMVAWAVHQGGPYPNQPKWKHLAAEQSWHPCLPTTRIQGAVIDSINVALKDVWWMLNDNGYDPRQVFHFGAGNEHGNGGRGDESRPANDEKPKSGTGKLSPGMAAWLDDVDGTAVDKLRDLLAWLGGRDEFIGGRPVWVGETGGKGDPRQQCSALLALGVECVGWFG